MTHHNQIILAAGIAAIASDLIPTPADAIFFSANKKSRDAFIKGEINEKQYWWRQIDSYYLPNAAWWTLVLLATMAVKDQNKLKVALALVSGGVVIGILAKNIKADKEIHLKLKQAQIKI